MAGTRFSREGLLAAPAARSRRARSVRLQDVDAAGVVFFARILEFFHDALMEHLAQEGFSMPAMLAEGHLLAPIKHAEADYLAPLHFGDRVEIELVAAAVAPTEVTIGYRVLRETEPHVAAVGQTRHICIDARTGARAPLPEALAAALRRLGPEGGR